MTVAVAHQVSPSSQQALTEGAREASFRGTQLAVIHVVESLDKDIAAANEAGISDAVQKVLSGAGLTDVAWDLHLIAGGTEVADVASAVLDKVGEVAPDLLVIGARRRSPVGKAFLG